MEVIQGYIEKIVYRNSDNGYTVMELAAESGEVTCVGIFHFINEGEYVISHVVYDLGNEVNGKVLRVLEGK